MRLRLIANVRREQSKLDGLLANVCERSRTFSFIERRAGVTPLLFLYSVGRNDNFLAKVRKLSILPTPIDIFDLRQHYIRILYIYKTYPFMRTR